METSTDRIEIKPPCAAFYAASAPGDVKETKTETSALILSQEQAAEGVNASTSTMTPGHGFEPVGLVTARIVCKLMASLQKEAT